MFPPAQQAICLDLRLYAKTVTFRGVVFYVCSFIRSLPVGRHESSGTVVYLRNLDHQQAQLIFRMISNNHHG